MRYLLMTMALLASMSSYSQVGIGTNTVDNSALLELNSTSKGILIPRMTTAQRTSIASPAAGLMVYDSNINQFFFHNGSTWVQAVGPAGTNGNTLLSGTTGPVASIGTNGDFYLRLNASRDLYGPKATGIWPVVPVSLTGPQGPAGTNGNTVLSGAGGPAAGIGTNGDFYLRLNASRDLYGPKAGGIWPVVPVSLTGPQGPSGIISTIAMNYSAFPADVTIPKGTWVMGPGAKQVTLTVSGALVNATVTTKIVTGAPASLVYCNICYGTGALAPSSGTPINEAGETHLVSANLINSAYQAISVSGKVVPPSAGTYWIAPCFLMTENLSVTGSMGYILILE